VTALRSTNQEAKLASGIPILLDLSHLQSRRVELVYSLVEIWLRHHCHSPWTLEELQETPPDGRLRTYIRIVFQDPREAVQYRLSPSYLSI
jgi:hypothetical protein